MEDKKYILVVLKLNPWFGGNVHLFPMTDKSNHGIDLKIWSEVLTDIGIYHRIETFQYLGSDRIGEKLVILANEYEIIRAQDSL